MCGSVVIMPHVYRQNGVYAFFTLKTSYKSLFMAKIRSILLNQTCDTRDKIFKVRPQLSFEGTTKTKTVLKPA